MPLRVERKGTILIPSGPSNDEGRKHLFVICTDPCAAGQQLLVPISKMVNDLCDETCILQKYEHEFLSHVSYAFYRKSRIEYVYTLKNGVEEGLFTLKAPFNGQTFIRIKNGICLSPHTPRKVKFYFGCN